MVEFSESFVMKFWQSYQEGFRSGVLFNKHLEKNLCVDVLFKTNSLQFYQRRKFSKKLGFLQDSVCVERPKSQENNCEVTIGKISVG